MINKISRKEQERNLKRGDIMEAAESIFAERGFENSTLEEISDAADFGKGTIYHYFSGKEEIYSAIIQKLFHQYLNTIKKADKNSGTIKEFFQLLMREMFSFSIENKSAFLLLVQIRVDLMRECSLKIFDEINEYHEEIIKIYLRRINSAIRKKEIIKINARAFAILFKGMALSHINYILIDQKKKKIEIEDEIEFILKIIFDGIENKGTEQL